MTTKNVSISTEEIAVTLTVRRATFHDQVQRDILISRAVEESYPDDATRTIAVVLHPRAVACIEPDGLISYPNGYTIKPDEITAAQFAALSPEVAQAWLDAVWEINPRWMPGFGVEPAPEQEKKA